MYTVSQKTTSITLRNINQFSKSFTAGFSTKTLLHYPVKPSCFSYW